MNINLTQQLRYTDYYKFLGLEVVDTLGDGNCLFRAVSVLLYGSEEHHAQLREVCFKQMVLVTLQIQFQNGHQQKDFVSL